MSDAEAVPQGVTRTESNPLMYGAEAKSVQEFRLDFRQDIKELRTGLTGIRYVNGKSERVIDEGVICEKHFNRVLNMIFFSNNRGWTLSRLHEEKIESYIIWMMDRVHNLLLNKCYFCDECAINDADDVAGILSVIEPFLYGNMNRAAGGFESGILAQMQQVHSTERYDREREKSGLFGTITNVFRRST